MAVNILVPIVQAADHGQDFAGSGAADDDGRVTDVVVTSHVVGPERWQELRRLAPGGNRLLDDGGLVLAGQTADVGASHALGLFLQVQVECGVDPQPAAIHGLRDDFGHILQLFAHIDGKVGVQDVVSFL